MSEKLNSYLKNLRAYKKKSLRQVEADTKISNAHLSQIEQGSIEKPSLDLLKTLSDYYQVEFSYLKKLAGYSSSESLAEVPQDNRLIPLKYITATQLHSFSDSKEAEGLLPEMVRDLVVSTVNYNSLDMPVGGSVFMHGWDGLLECTAKPEVQFVPEGYSCWEMSKSKKISKKIEQDFTKRTKKSSDQIVENSTYVQVTFRRMGKSEKIKFASDAKANSKWKDVKIIDAEDLELWLERSPIVALAYAKKLGLFPQADGLIPLSDFWGQWWASTYPAIDQSLLIEAGKRCEGVTNFLQDQFIEHLKIKSNDIEVGVAFFYAMASTCENSTLAQSIISRSVVVKSEDAFRLLSSRGQNLILIPTIKGIPIGEAKLNGHRIVSIINNFNPTDLDSVGRVRTSIMTEFLRIEGGFSDEKAYRVAKSCYGNLSVLHAMLAGEGESSYPVWSKADYGRDSLLAMMLGGWNANNASDKEIVERITQKKYSDVEDFLEKIPDDNTKLFLKINNSYSFYQEYGYIHLSKYINDQLINTFFEVAKEVLCDVNTKYELEPEKRFAADIYKKGNKYSEKIRNGIATSVAMLANMQLPSMPHLELRIENLVSEILGDESDWKFWASLSSMTLLLAEASPTAFLDKLEKVCRKSDFIEILSQTTTMGGCDYSNLLWALEMCAWERKHFKQVSKILMDLAEFENKKSNYMNQPSNSLRDIYRVWANQSCLGFHERMTVLKELAKHNPNQVWELLLKIVPTTHGIGGYTQRPRFRDVDIETVSDSHEVEYIDMMNTLIDYILNLLEKNSTRWLSALDLIFEIRPQSYQVRLLNNLLKLKVEEIPQECRDKIWQELGRNVARHVEFPDADWSAKGILLKKLKKAYELFTPKDAVAKWSHIFDHYISHPDIENVDHDYNKKQELLGDLQKRAIKEIIKTKGIDVLTELISLVPSKWILGFAFAEVFSERFFDAVKIANQHPDGADFFKGLVFTLYRLKGDSWLSDVLVDSHFQNVYTRTNVFLSLPVTSKLWKKIDAESTELQQLFWTKIGRVYINDYDEAILVINKFLEFEKPLDAFYVLANFERREKKSIPSELSMRVLDSVVNYDLSADSGKVDFSLFDYHLENLLKELGSREDIDKRRLALIEWNFLPLFKYRKKPENLTHEVNNDPSMFIDILKIAYKKDDKTSDETGNQSAITRAYQFLHENKTLPGVDKSGVLNADHFQNWFLKTRELAIQCNRLASFDNVIGKLLAHSPTDPEDGSWPHKAVRDVFEQFSSTEMERALIIGIFNKRGIIRRSMGEGGIQERQLSKRYGGYAEATERSWPKISKVLRHMEARYSVDAHQEDLRSLHD